MDTKELSKVLRPFFKPPRIYATLLLLFAAVIFGVVLVAGVVTEESAPITEDQIMIQKGDKIVIVNENGLVEYRTSEGIFYEVWDNSRVSQFFASMQAKAKEYLANAGAGPPPGAYAVTLFIDGQLVTIYLTDDEELDEVFDEFSDPDGSGDSISDLFDDDEDDQDTDTNGGGSNSPTPTPLPEQVSAQDDDDDGDGGGGEEGGTTQDEQDCTLFGQVISGKTVISNTVCKIIQP